MALSLRCSCGAEFEVEDTFAGQSVSCPDCGQPVKAPPLRPAARRTSGWALASVVLALVGAFTLVGTLLAAVLGVIALVSIARHRDRISGVGYAVFGIVLGVTFTALTGFAAVNGELFDRAREQFSGSEVERGGPRELVREHDGFAITRPSREWGVATPDFARHLECEGELVLVNPAKDAYIEVARNDAAGQTLEQFREDFLDGWRNPLANQQNPFRRVSDFKLRESKRLPPLQGAEVLEVTFEAKMAGQALAYRTRMIKPQGGDVVYVLHAWAHRRRLSQVEAEIIEAMDSFRLLGGG